MSDQLIIFDLDGTILDTIQDLGNAANHALKAKGFPLHSKAEYPFLVGNGIRNLVKRSLPEKIREDEGLVDSTLADFKSYYCAHIHDETKPYPGIPELLAALQNKGYRLAVASNKFHEGTVTLIKHFFPEINFASITGNKPGIPLKPSPEIVDFIRTQTFGTSGHDNLTIIVGDSEVDIRTAQAAGIPSIAVTWGFRHKENLTEADFMAENAEELMKVILNLSYEYPEDQASDNPLRKKTLYLQNENSNNMRGVGTSQQRHNHRSPEPD